MNNNNFVYELRPMRSFRELISGSAEEYGERPAILYSEGGEEVTITYAQFFSDIKALSSYFNSVGLGGKKIAIMGKNSYAWMLTYMAVTCGVGVIVPIDKELKADDLGNILKMSGTEAIVFDKGSLKTLDDSGSNGIRRFESEKMGEYLDAGRQLIENGDRSYEKYRVDPDALSVLIYTSGTTGVAKGVMLSQYNICSNIIGVRSRVAVYPFDRSLEVLPLHHTYESMSGFLTFIYSGASIAISGGLRHIADEFKKYQPTILIAVPLLVESIHAKLMKKYSEVRGGKLALSLGRTTAKAGAIFGAKNPPAVFKPVHEFFGGKLNRILIGAAALSPAVSRDFEAFGFKVYSGYGLTETAPVCIMHDDFNRNPDNMGRPISGVKVRLEHTSAEDLVGIGRHFSADVGEIAVKGPNVMLGYYNDPEQTSRVIRDGWFYTGDLAIKDSDGNYRIVGRIKNMIVTANGKKIFPEEMEYYLNKSIYISDSLVCGEEDGKGEVTVCARVFPDYEAVNAVLLLRGVTPESPEYRDEVLKIIEAEAADVNKRFAAYKAIRRVTVRKEDFIKTSTRKIRRADPANHTEE